jgi:hypothetical protein
MIRPATTAAVPEQRVRGIGGRELGAIGFQCGLDRRMKFCEKRIGTVELDAAGLGAPALRLAER